MAFQNNGKGHNAQVILRQIVATQLEIEIYVLYQPQKYNSKNIRSLKLFMNYEISVS